MTRRRKAASTARSLLGAASRGAMAYAAGHSVWFHGLGAGEQVLLALGLTSAPWTLPVGAAAVALGPLALRAIVQHRLAQLEEVAP